MQDDQVAIMAVLSLLIGAQIVAVVLRAAGFRFYILAAIVTFVAGGVALALWLYLRGDFHPVTPT